MTTPRKFIPHTPSKERFAHGLKRLVEEEGRTISDDFNIDDIHWATDRIGITDYEGCSESVLRGYFTINVAGEIDSSADIQADIDPGSGTVKEDLTELVALMDQVLRDNPEAKIEELIKIIPGPDFPTGGVMVESKQSIKEAYTLGKGSFRLRAKWQKIKQKRGNYQILITETGHEVLSPDEFISRDIWIA